MLTFCGEWRIPPETSKPLFFCRTETLSTRLDEKHFKTLHNKAFGTLYDLAGKYRKVDMGEGKSLFCLAEHISKESQHLFRQPEQEDFFRQNNTPSMPTSTATLARSTRAC